MAGELVPLVMLPRYSVFVGKLTGSDLGYTTIAMDVSDYQNAILNVWRGVLLGTTAPSFDMYFEESTDQVAWTNCSVTTTDSGPPYHLADKTEIQYIAALSKRWFRMRIALGGTTTDTEITCWAVGFLEQRIR